ncbi:MAG: transposase [Chitinophagales bacterium]
MDGKFRDTYRIASHRKPYWDYSADALYFLTIVTQHRECNLGKIVKKESVDRRGRVYQRYEIILTDFGKIVEQEWLKSFAIRDELFLHEFVIMPNHIHAIVEIYNKNRDDANNNKFGGSADDDINDANAIVFPVVVVVVETHGRVSLQQQQPKPSDSPKLPKSESLPIKRNPPIRLPKSISSFIAGFKSAVNTKIDNYIDKHQLDTPKYNRNNHFFQPNYHDHIIRNQQEHIRISRYIINNPANWDNDKFHGKI